MEAVLKLLLDLLKGLLVMAALYVFTSTFGYLGYWSTKSLWRTILIFGSPLSVAGGLYYLGMKWQALLIILAIILVIMVLGRWGLRLRISVSDDYDESD